MMLFSKLEVAALVCHLASVYSVSISSNQQIGRSNDSASRLLPAGYFSPSNLTIPLPIPGFGVRLLFDGKPTLILWQVFSNAIALMYLLAVRPGDDILEDYIQVTETIYIEQVILSPWPPDKSSSRLRIKHGIVALYEAGTALAEIPMKQRGLVPRLYAILSVEDQQIGTLKWLHKLNSQNSEANSTVSLVRTQNSTDVLQMLRSDIRTTVRRGFETIVDPDDPKFEIIYERGDKKVDLPEVFSAYLDAMAAASFNNVSKVGAHVEAASVSGDVVLNVHEFGIVSTLSWGQLLKSLFLIWFFLIAEESVVEIDFELLYDGAVNGHGFLWSLNAPRASLLSS